MRFVHLFKLSKIDDCLPVPLLILTSVESLLVFIWLALIPADPKNALLGPFSVARLALLTGALIATVGFAILAFLGWRGLRSDRWYRVYHWLFARPVIPFNILALVLAVDLYFLILPPPNLIPPGSGIAQRVRPLLIWSVLVGIQWGGWVLTRYRQEVQGWFSARSITFRRWIEYPLAGYIMLGLSVMVAITQVYYIYYNLGDESNTITIGWLMAKGWKLYDEVFSHHFPFSYVWVAWVIKAFGASFATLRISWIVLRTLIFALAMKVSRYPFAIGLTALSWSILGHFYLGNGLFYHSFTGMFEVAAFVIGLALLERKAAERGWAAATAGILLGLAVLTDPLKVLPAGILVLAVFVSGLSWPWRLDSLKRGFVQAGPVALMILACLAGGALWLISTNNMAEFYHAAIEFNLGVYRKYSPGITLQDVTHSVVGFLNLFDPQWRMHLDPYYQWGSYVQLDTWVFTSFFFRLAIIMSIIVSLARGEILKSIYIYLFAAMILIRGSTFFHASAFVLLSLCVVSLFLSGDLSPTRPIASVLKNPKLDRILGKSALILSLLSWIVLFGMFTWLNVRGAAFLIENKEKMAYSDKFAGIDADAAYLRAATCHQPEARILVYPYEPIQYFSSQILPASRYHFMLPWVAEVGQEQVISDLASQPALVLIAREGEIWGYPVREYLSKLLEYLDQNYIFIEKADRYQVYRSPSLEQLCQAASNP